MALAEALREGDIVPDVIDQAAPEERHVRDIQIQWKGGASGNEVIGEISAPGVVLSPRQTHDKPRVTFGVQTGADSGGRQLAHSRYYTVIMTDPDAPSRADPKFREFLHWIRGNCEVRQGAAGAYVDANASGEEVAAYLGAGAPKGTSLHRYVFLIYGHDEPIEFRESWPRSADNRPLFKVREFAKKYGLGDPVGVTYYRAEYDEWTDKLLED